MEDSLRKEWMISLGLFSDETQIANTTWGKLKKQAFIENMKEQKWFVSFISIICTQCLNTSI